MFICSLLFFLGKMTALKYVLYIGAVFEILSIFFEKTTIEINR